jgi:flagellar biosynthesis/type III secretory pathway protein FliH
MEPVRPYYLPSFEKEAEAIVARARELARDLTVSAAAEAVRIRDEAQREGFERGQAEGRERARQEEARKLDEGIRKIPAEVERHRSRLELEAERDVVRLAIAIAEKVIKVEVKRGKSVAGTTSAPPCAAPSAATRWRSA